MKVHVDLTALKRTKWYEYTLRFLFGGLITAIASVIARKLGPEIGGLFLAFPAIFPASATLVEKHEKQKKRRAGFDGTKRARTAAGVDAMGTAMGCLGLITFAVIVWKNLPSHSIGTTLLAATLAWLVVCVSTWLVCDKKRIWRRRAMKASPEK
jgi:4-hydroxybenzoate polyprenyltransferase